MNRFDSSSFGEATVLMVLLGLSTVSLGLRIIAKALGQPDQ